MAGLRATAQGPEISLAQGTTKTILQINAPANHRLKIKGWGISTDGKTPQEESIQAQLVRTTTAGTFSSLTPLQIGSYAETLQATAGHTATGEPTVTDVLRNVEVSSYNGQWAEQRALGDEWEVPGGGRIAIRVISPATMTTLAVIPYIEYEE